VGMALLTVAHSRFLAANGDKRLVRVDASFRLSSRSAGVEDGGGQLSPCGTRGSW